MKKYIIDIEANGLNPTKVWCVVLKDIDTNQILTFTHEDNYGNLKELADLDCIWIGHNCVDYDLDVLARLIGFTYRRENVIDTLILSRLYKFTLQDGHSLDAWGKRLRFPKQDFNEWDTYSPKMLEYCINDVHLTHKVYEYLMGKYGKFADAIKVEHEMAFVCRDMKREGFPFNIQEAKKIYEEISTKLHSVDLEIKTAFPPRVRGGEVVSPKLTKFGTISKSNMRWWGSNDLSCFSAGAPFTRIEWEEFNPGSPKQVVERLEGWWHPTEKTDSHIEAERSGDKDRLEKFKRYGWRISESNLATLRDDAPEGARLLVLRLLLASRLRTLTEWFNAYEEKTRSIHGTFNGIGTWTHRMSHSKPNMGNIATEKSIKYKTQHLSELALNYGKRMRDLWGVAEREDDRQWLVGTDAEGIQLRILAHYVNDPTFTKAIVEGKKEDGTDIHTVNQRNLGSVCTSRDSAKTFIYAFLLGAGLGKIAEIFGCTKRLAGLARDQFIERTPGLKYIREELIPADASRGYFLGLDGRPVIQDSEHLMLAGYLQTGEACVMKHANILWRKELNERGIKFQQVNFVHDEWQTIVFGTKDVAETVASIQRESIRQVGERLNVRCPLSGSSSIGKTWYETH